MTVTLGGSILPQHSPFRKCWSYLSLSLNEHAIHIWHVCQWLWSAEKWLGLNLTACYDHVMFASQQPSDCDFLRGVCLHCRKIGMIYMRYWKQKAWAWISAMWLQVVMSISRCTLLHNVWPLVVWSNILVTSIYPNLNIGWPTIS